MGTIRSREIFSADVPFSALELSGANGDVIDVVAPADFSYNDQAQFIIWTDGVVRCRRIGLPDDDARQLRTPGMTSFEWNAAYPRIVPKGTFRFSVESLTATYYCVMHRQKKKLDKSTFRVGPGESVTIPQGQYAFIADGDGMIKGGRVFSAPAMVYAQSKDVVLLGTTSRVLLGVNMKVAV